MPFFEGYKTLRRIKERIRGVRRMKEDPLEGERAIASDFFDRCKIFNTTVGTLSNVMEKLASVNNELVESTKSFYPNDNPYAPIRATMSEALEHLKTTIRGRGNNLEGMKYASEQLMKQGLDMNTMLTDRDRAHNLMSHYEVKVKKLKGSKKTHAEKMDRNQLKHSFATHSFEELDKDAHSRLSGVLATRDKEFATLLGLLCSYLATITREMEECTKPLGAVYKRVELIHGRNREGMDANPFPSPSLNPFDEVNSEVTVLRGHRQSGQLGHHVPASQSVKTVITHPSSEVQQKTPSGVSVEVIPDAGTPTTVKHISRDDADAFDPDAIMEEETIRVGEQSSVGSLPGSATKQEETPEEDDKESHLMDIIKG
ncbi:hypothetical protein Pmar_PMAR004010 [Perkinsus marinus ATCC 50983]|uniref:BAR domain-containing protein n=1 Tax=Perkinsus marinus (strain ATCC 50983 / TXsc) TaxID=423536 RepID=C5M0H0_PERM5|nr:hypothetical protein Pmar_PMAR004010 [Perkinsus marinus ATCC 50983]EEQ97505.1 hypothetical protein Pmar_PMAR004010 [Perkinsus marinus ATCC 50983]|eukprot:XP_002764788.1 hypothetical protein Pmar_PMAR004010 [Perkinsus marinus ATCC 50983]